MYVIPGVKAFGAIFNNLGPIESNPVDFATSILDRELLTNGQFTRGIEKFVSSFTLVLT